MGRARGKRQERAPFEECDPCHRRGFCSAGSNVRVIMRLRLEVWSRGAGCKHTMTHVPERSLIVISGGAAIIALEMV